MSGYYEVAIGWTSPAGKFKNILHYVAGDENPPGWQEFANYVGAKFIEHWDGRCATSFGLEKITVREDIENGVGVDYFPAGSPISGTNIDGEFLGQAAVLVKKISNGPSRPVQGRLYLPGAIGANFTDQSAWNNGTRDDAQAFVESLRLYSGVVEDLNLQMLIKAADPTRPNTTPYGIVTEVQALNAVSTIRSRKRGVGI